MTVASESFTYSPQDSVYNAETINLFPGEEVTLHSIIGGENNIYQWKQDGTVVGSDSVFTITNAEFANNGIYTCEITNTLATELTIYRRPITLNVMNSVAEQDSLALVALYNNTDGDNWINNENWLTGPVSSWFGITIVEGRVTEIDLSENELNGTIPTEIGNLTNLHYLYLYSNQLSDEIPVEIGNLTGLRILRLYSNQLTGEIPSEIGNLTNLTSFSLGSNQLTGEIPTEIENLSNLTSLSLYSNELSGEIPDEVGNISNLHLLQLQSNELTGEIPAEIGDLNNPKLLWSGARYAAIDISTTVTNEAITTM